MTKRSENGQFQSRTTKPEAETQKPASGDKRPATERAAEALDRVLDDAIRSNDADRILEASKLLASFRRMNDASEAEGSGGIITGSDVIDLMTSEERAELLGFITRGYIIRAKAQIRNGLKPLFERPLGEKNETEIIEAARAELRADATRSLSTSEGSPR
jgi:hypothetical protein